MTNPTPGNGKKDLLILVVEDDELTRNGLVFSLSKFPGIKIVGEVENGYEAVQFVQTNPVDIVLMDIFMPVMGGIDATQEIKSIHSDIKIIILTSHKDQDLVFLSFKAGADGYCMKNIKSNRLYQVIEMVSDGTVCLDPDIAELVLKATDFMSKVQQKPDLPGTEDIDLTTREKEVLQLIADGMSNKEISSALNISIFTVKNHVNRIIQKMAVDNRTQAALKAMKDKLF